MPLTDNTQNKIDAMFLACKYVTGYTQLDFILHKHAVRCKAEFTVSRISMIRLMVKIGITHEVAAEKIGYHQQHIYVIQAAEETMVEKIISASIWKKYCELMLENVRIVYRYKGTKNSEPLTIAQYELENFNEAK